MSKNYINTQQSGGKSVISRRWKVDVRDVVNNYNFRFHHAHADGGKCELCGNNLGYVAVITGKSLTEGNTDHNSTDKVMDVGLDCLQLVFGRDWNDFRKTKKEIDKLKKIAAQERRKKKYAENYKDIINWLNTLPVDYLRSNRFLSDMKVILETGSKIFTINMEGGIRRWMSKSAENIDEYSKKLEHHKNVVIPKIEKLRNLVIEVDGINDTFTNVPKWSAFSFVNSVLFFAKNTNKITMNQIESLGKIHKRYTVKKNKMEKNKSSIEYIDTSGIPF